MKKLGMLFLCVLSLFLVTGCGTKPLDPTSMTKEEIIAELRLVNNDLLHAWNDSLVKISWYSVEGVDYDGKEINIDQVIRNLKDHYADFEVYDTFINSLDETYGKVKETWDILYQETDTIYQAVLKEKPQASVAVPYKNSINTYEEYQSLFNAAIDALDERKD